MSHRGTAPGRPRTIKGTDSFYRGREIVGTQTWPDWPLMEAVCLLGRVKQNMRVKADATGKGGRTYQYAAVIEDIERRYGRRFNNFDEALPFMETIVAREKQTARDRAAQYRKASP